MGSLCSESGGVSEVRVGCESAELLFFVGREGEGVEEGVECLGGERLAASEGFELFVGRVELEAAHDGLDGFGEDFPRLVEVLLEAVRVGFDLRESFLEGGKGDQGVGKGRAAVAQRGGVGQIALPSGDREFLCEVFEQGVGDAEIAFGIFKFDGVDFVRHGGGADFALDRALSKISKRDVPPEITGKIDEDGVASCDGMEEFSDPVVGFDLCGVGIPSQSKRVDEGLGDLCPVDVWISDMVGVVVADGTVDLAEYRGFVDALISLLEADGKVGDLFAEGGGGGGLSVCAGKHGESGVLVGEFGECVMERAEVREKDGISGFAKHQGVGEVVDIFGGAGKVQKFLMCVEGGMRVEAFFEEVFDGFDVVVDGFFDLLDAKGVLCRKVVQDIFEEGVFYIGKRRYFGDIRVLGESLKPADLDPYAVVDQAVFAEEQAQRLCFFGITSVDRGKGEELCVLVHGVSLFFGVLGRACSEAREGVALWKARVEFEGFHVMDLALGQGKTQGCAHDVVAVITCGTRVDLEDRGKRWISNHAEDMRVAANKQRGWVSL